MGGGLSVCAFNLGGSVVSSHSHGVSVALSGAELIVFHSLASSELITSHANDAYIV